jgi:hypothetical protein
MGCAYRVLVGRLDGKRPVGWPRHRWEDNIKMDYLGVGWWDMDSIDVAQDRESWRAVLNVVMNLQVSYNKRNLLNGWGTVSVSGRTCTFVLLQSPVCHISLLWNVSFLSLLGKSLCCCWECRPVIVHSRYVAAVCRSEHHASLASTLYANYSIFEFVLYVDFIMNYPVTFLCMIRKPVYFDIPNFLS